MSNSARFLRNCDFILEQQKKFYNETVAAALDEYVDLTDEQLDIIREKLDEAFLEDALNSHADVCEIIEEICE